MSEKAKEKKLGVYFQKKSNGQICSLCKKRPATCSHHVVNRDHSEVLRYVPENGVDSCNECHTPDGAEKYNEWTLPGLSSKTRFMLNSMKLIDIQDFLMKCEISKEEWYDQLIAEYEQIFKEREMYA